MNDKDFEKFMEDAKAMDAHQAETFFEMMAENYRKNAYLLENMEAEGIGKLLSVVSLMIRNRTGE